MRKRITRFSTSCLLVFVAIACTPSQPEPAASPRPALTTEIASNPVAMAWLRSQAISFKTTKPGSGFDDLQPLKKIIGNARIVALGEATHGTHEFFEMKHRLLEFLVTEMGFSTLAMEASWPEANRVNNYIQTGEGDPAVLLSDLHFWIWNTQEVLDMIKWMRAHNERPGNAPKVSFYGFDMQFPGMAMDDVVDYLRGLDPIAAEQAELLFRCFREYQNKTREYADAFAEYRSECRTSLEQVDEGLMAHRAEYETASSASAFSRTRQALRVILQAEDLFSRKNDYAVRDRYMAENVAWLLKQAGPDSKLVLWAHNAHVSGYWPGNQSMGSFFLPERFRGDMVIFGFSFYEGSFNAVALDVKTGRTGKLGVQHAAPPPLDSFETYFHSADMPLMFLDLRQASPGLPETDWLYQEHRFREIGAMYDSSAPLSFAPLTSLSSRYDVVVYFDQTTPSKLLPFR